MERYVYVVPGMTATTASVCSSRFVIDAGDDQHERKERSEAVSLAKRLSQAMRNPVFVRRLDGQLRMEFRDGKMTRFRSVR